MRARATLSLLVVAGGVLVVVALVFALRPFHLSRDFVPTEASEDEPTWVWTIPCGSPLRVAADRSEVSALDPACYVHGPRRLVIPVAIAAVGLAALAIGRFGRRDAAPSATEDSGSRIAIDRRRIGAIAGAAIVLGGLGTVASSSLAKDGTILSLDDRLPAGDSTVPLRDQPSRYYEAHVPRSIDGPVPLLVVLHGSNSGAEAVAKATGLSAFADRHDVLVVYPQATKYEVEGFGTGGYWNVPPCSFGPATCWNPAMIEEPDDVRYLRGVIADVTSRTDVDPERIFVVGHSLGGTMAGRLGCEAADRITGVIVLNSSMEIEPCRPREPLPVMVFHTADDEVVPPKGNRFYKPLTDSIEAWRMADRCEGRGSRRRERSVTTTTYDDCAGDVSVELVLVSSGGHDWITDPIVDWRTLMWRFLTAER